jgi:hypothetical protein
VFFHFQAFPLKLKSLHPDDDAAADSSDLPKEFSVTIKAAS